jgi:hypothetical protein
MRCVSSMDVGATPRYWTGSWPSKVARCIAESQELKVPVHCPLFHYECDAKRSEMYSRIPGTQSACPLPSLSLRV